MRRKPKTLALRIEAPAQRPSLGLSQEEFVRLKAGDVITLHWTGSPGVLCFHEGTFGYVQGPPEGGKVPVKDYKNLTRYVMREQILPTPHEETEKRADERASTLARENRGAGKSLRDGQQAHRARRGKTGRQADPHR